MIKTVLVAIFILFSYVGTTHAQSDQLARCLADNTTGKDRKDLARWIFVAMGAHPELRDLVLSSQDATEQANKRMAALVMRLMSESCVAEVRTLHNNGESDAMRRAFESLGALAMMELSSNPSVAASVAGFGRYVDQAKLTAAIGGK
jgi:hypothetical protein